MIVFHDDIDHLLTIKELFYRYIFETDLENFELFKKRNFSLYANDMSIDTQLSKLKFLIRICDFEEMQNILANLSHDLKYEKEYHIKFLGVNLEYAEIFNQLALICMHYSRIVNRGDGNSNQSFGDSDKIEFSRNIQEIR